MTKTCWLYNRQETYMAWCQYNGYFTDWSCNILHVIRYWSQRSEAHVCHMWQTQAIFFTLKIIIGTKSTFTHLCEHGEGELM